MSPDLQKLLGQAVVRIIHGDKEKASELAKEAYIAWYKENHLHATIKDILDSKNQGRISV